MGGGGIVHYASPSEVDHTSLSGRLLLGGAEGGKSLFRIGA